MRNRWWALRAVAALAMAAALGACGGGGGGSGGGSGAGTTGGGAAQPPGPGAGGATATVPSNLTLADVGPYPAKPVATTGGTGSAGGSGSGSGTGTGTPTGSGGAAYQPTGPKTLVLYDAPPGDEFQKLGFSYAIMLRNLLGHFDADVELVPVQQYTAGKIAAYQATFYLGAFYDSALPAAFLADAATTTKPLVWFKYNLWQLAGNTAYRFTETRGMTFDGLRGLNALPTATTPKPGFFDTVSYKQLDFVKYYAWDAQRNVVNADPDIGVVAIADAAKAAKLVEIRNPKTGEAVPYVTRAGNFWYVADLPFSYIGPRDRYLVLADLLHDMLGVDHAESHLAMVRLEDVGAPVSVRAMRRLSDFLSSRNVGFSIAVIPHHKDPFGAGNSGVPQDIPFAQATNLRTALDYALPRGAEVVMHGYTHQYGAMKNPWSGMSGDDYEFWDNVHNAPVPEDSSEWALNRFLSGLWELTSASPTYGPVAWETPHYVASAAASKAMPLAFNTTYQRVVYFTADKPDFTPRAGKDFMAGQIFPYVIARDYYGQRVLPENLGNIEYDISRIDPSSNLTYTWNDIRINAQYAKAVRDGFASFFFHPFWIEKEIAAETNAQPYEDFTDLVQAISAMGYTWVKPSQVR